MFVLFARLIDPCTKITMKVTITIIFLLLIIYTPKDSLFKNEILRSILLYLLLLTRRLTCVDQVVKPIKGDKFYVMQIDQLRGDEFEGVVSGHKVLDVLESGDEIEFVVVEIEVDELRTVVNEMMGYLVDLIVIDDELFQGDHLWKGNIF